MSLRRRISLVAAATVAIAVAAAVLVSYFAVRHQMIGQVDTQLTAQASAMLDEPLHTLPAFENGAGAPARVGGKTQYWQIVWTNGRVTAGSGGVALPHDSRTTAVATGAANAYTTNVSVNGTVFRVYTFHTNVQYDQLYVYPAAIEVATPLGPTLNVLSKLRLILALIFLACVALAAGLGRLAVRRVMMPLSEVSATAQLIGETDDLSRRLEIYQDDEVGQLASSFNEMLERLESSRADVDASVMAQRQLVADASHELRTPVTSLRTNIEVLLAGAVLDDEDRERLLADVVEQSEELSALVSDLIEVARGDVPSSSLEDTRVDRVVEVALDRARRNAPDVRFNAHLEPVSVNGNPERLSRAINNLLDNASRHTEPGTTVEVTVDAEGIVVRDHGAGIAEQDLPHIFDRFYRGENARARQGSGLGLAIVRQVAQQHGGSVTAANADDGGAVFTLRLPGSAVPDHAGVASGAEVSA